MNPVITFGEMMIRLSTPNYERFSQSNCFNVHYGGGESNVAVSLANFGISVEFVTRFPKNDLADAAFLELRKRGVGTQNIIRGGERLGIYFLETGAVARASNVIYDRMNSSFSEVKPGMFNWDSIFEKASWFHWTGISPAVSQSAADTCLEAIIAAKEHGITISTDLNYRKKLWKYGTGSNEIMEELTKYCDIILGNEEDAKKHFNIHPEDVDVRDAQSVDAIRYQSVCRQLKQRFPNAKKIITTLRGSTNANYNTWSGILYNGKDFYTAPVYNITDIVDRVGSGDSFMAGLIYGLMTWPEDDEKALHFATAASCLKHTIHGDANLVSIDEVNKLMLGDQSGRVSR